MPDRILVFNVNWLGDVLFSTASIRNLRRNYPKSFIACVIPSRCYPVLKGNPNLDQIIIYDEQDRHKSLLAKISFIKTLAGKRFDMGILLHGSLTRALILRLAGIKQIIGYNTKHRGFLLDKKIPLPKKDSLHRIDYYLNILEKSGLRVEDRFLEFFINDEDEIFVADFLKRNSLNSDDLIVGLNPAGNWLLKRWPKQYWAGLADRLINDYNAKVVITGSPDDLKLAGEIGKLMIGRPVVSCGMNLKQSAALFKKLNLFISADSGPLHIANAVGAKKIIALFGPTDINITGPFPLNNVVVLQKDSGCKIPCYDLDCSDNRCMRAITPEDVLRECKKIL
ncbi:MAG: lipopolysaccharide heptosyltransferase II [Candidatus Omnitrophica bacterium]|jgi:lipopolysaccharide heptosyltransferase II|nr:lipopolysaccharide heptosyltransferase II [Candidatus Omnitrophota bacterium]